MYDDTGDFSERVNYEMVKLEELTDEDRSWLHGTILRHRELTGSTVADGIVSSWAVEVSKFRKVMPSDYKRVPHRHRRIRTGGPRRRRDRRAHHGGCENVTYSHDGPAVNE